MFDSLDDQMKKDLDRQTTTKQRMLLWLAVAAASGDLDPFLDQTK